MQFSTTTLTLFLTALASLSTTQARIGQTYSDHKCLMGGCGGPVEEGVDDFLTCTRFPGYMWVDCSGDNHMLEEATAGNFHVSVNDRQLEDDTTAEKHEPSEEK